jgi:hypothetical protein
MWLVKRFRIPIQRANGRDPRTGLPWEWDSVLFERWPELGLAHVAWLRDED